MQEYYWFIIFILANSTLLLVLAFNVSRIRIKHQIGRGDGDNLDLKKAINAHANNTEQIPIYALLILSLEFVAANNGLLACLVIVFTASRLLHAYGLLYKAPTFVRIGALLTYITQALGVIALLWYLINQ